MKRFLLLALIALLPLASHGETHTFRTYRVEDGLSQDCVWSVLQDSQGFMWFGTKDGLDRFDGRRFKYFRRNVDNPSSLGNNFVRALMEDSRERLWVGTENGLYIYDRDMENFSQVELQPADITINYVMEDTSGNIWVATHGSGLFMLDPGLVSRKQFKWNSSDAGSVPSNYVWTLEQDNNGIVWVGTLGAGLSFYDEERNVFVKIHAGNGAGISDLTINSLYADDDNCLWIGTAYGGLDCLNLHTRAVSHHLSGRSGAILNIRAITRFSPAELVMGSDDGMIIFNKEAGTHRVINTDTPSSNISDNSVFCITQDREGSFWVGTYFGGVNYYSPALNMFSFYYPSSHGNSVSGNIVSCFTESPDGKVWIGTNDGGISLFDPAASSFTKPVGRASYHNIQCLMQDGNWLWVGLYSKGIDVFDIRTGRVVNYSHKASDPGSINDDIVFCLYKTRKDEIMAGTPIGVNIYMGDGKFSVIPELNGIHVQSILEDHLGGLWFATNSQGLFRRTSAGRWEQYRHDSANRNSISSNNVNAIFQDSKRRLWIGTEGGGLQQFDYTDFAFSTIDERHGLPNNVVYTIMDDVEGNIWVSTNKGLAKIDPETGDIKSYGYIDELQKIRFTYGAVMRSSSNELYFGGANGFTVFNPKDVTGNNAAPPIVITGFQIFNREVIPGEENSPLSISVTNTPRIELRNRHSSFSFDFASLSYLSPDQNLYSYKLDGFDKEWINAGNDPRAFYMNIPPGDYYLKLRGSNNDGLWNDSNHILRVTIKSHFLLSAWMLVLYFLILVGIAFWIVKQQSRRADRKSREKLEKYKNAKEKETYESKIKFFTNIAHEIRTPLSLITAPLENIITSGDGTPQTKANLEVVDRNTHRLLELVNQLLDFRRIEEEMFRPKYRTQDVNVIIARICSQYAHDAKEKGIEIRFEPSVETTEWKTDGEAFYKIVSNLLSNAVKHADKTVIVDTTVENNELVVTVRDDGRGISHEHIEKIFEPFYQIDSKVNKSKPGSGLGLPLAQSLAQRMNGYITVASDKASGTEFRLVLPVVDEAEQPEDIKGEEMQGEIRQNENLSVRILIAEDNEELLEFIRGNLAVDFDVVTVEDGAAALKVIESESIDLIISDIMMPGMDGLELCRIVKSDPAFSHIPFILLSAKTDTAVKIEGLEYGADVYIEKPFSIKHLRAQANSILENRNRMRENFRNSPLQYFKSDGIDTSQSGFIDRLNALVLENMNEKDFSIDSLAEQFMMSRSNFHKKIKAVTGLTPNDYIKLIRLNKAAELLSTGKYKINEVGYMVGFNTPSYFSRCFHEQFGKLPKDFIEER